jgi:hypothetical protein
MSALLLQWLFEESVSNAELSKDSLIIDAGIDDGPEADPGNGIVQIFGKLLLASWLIES